MYKTIKGIYIDMYNSFKPIINEVIWVNKIRYKVLEVRSMHKEEHRRDYICKIEEIMEI